MARHIIASDGTLIIEIVDAAIMISDGTTILADGADDVTEKVPYVQTPQVGPILAM